MGMFGKYGIKVLCGNGDEGFVMEYSRRDGGVFLTKDGRTAQRFATNAGAKNYYENNVREETVYNFDGQPDYAENAWTVIFE